MTTGDHFDRDIALAQYEKSIQAGFREVADALASSRALAAQRVALEAQVAAATQAQDLSRARYDAGADSFLVLLDTRRTLYAAEQALVARCKLLRVGRTLIVGEVALYSEGSDDPVAHVVGTYAIPPAPAAVD